MQSQLGLVTPFVHKECGGDIIMAKSPVQDTARAKFPWQPSLKYQCTKCGKFCEPSEVIELRDYT
jgi:hypothetical protein